MGMTRSWVVGALALLAILGVLAPSASGKLGFGTNMETASAGDVTATFTYTRTRQYTYPTKTLSIARAGQQVYSAPVSSKYCGLPGVQQYCAPGGFHSSIHVVNLEGNSEPDVLLDLFTGGAHCCSVEQVFSWDPGTMTYGLYQHDFGDPGERLVDLDHDGRYEFQTADDTFAYAFTDYADSGLPLQILSFSDHQFVNVTRHYPKLIAKDAASYLTAFKHDLGNGEGVLAAWTADEDNLGHQRLVATTLAKYLKAGDLRGGFVNGRKFIAALNKLLKKDGYVR